jgi:hypothetical protein
VFAQSADRIAKERAMRNRQLKRLWVVSRIFRTFVWRWPDPGSCYVGLG